MRYVTGMNRDRDSYQVAVALAERGHLEALVTDYYYRPGPVGLRFLSHRAHPTLDPELVVSTAGALIPQITWRITQRTGLSRDFPADRVDNAIARRITKVAQAHPDAGLFVYSNYAYDAFAKLPDRPRILFQYHPSSSVIQEALNLDELGTARDWYPETEVVSPRRRAIYHDEIAQADTVVCASDFTRRGLLADGVAEDALRVVPYGCPAPASSPDLLAPRERVALFVGQGIRRKGLHLLVEAWRQASLNGWRLRIVASRMEPAMVDAIRDLGDPSVEVSGSVSAPELERLYLRADTLVLPSLVEGFGLVLGEALARGCRIIATSNTGLSGMSLPDDVGRLIVPGRVAPLVEALVQMADEYRSEAVYRARAFEAAKKRNWATFRAGVAAVASELK